MVIGKPAKYVDEANALDYVAGYCVINDVSEHEWQIERGGTWDKGNTSVPVLINGFEPVSIGDIECIADITYEQAEAMGAIFRSILRLTDNREVRKLCERGALQANLQANDIDVIRERAVKAGLDVSEVRQ
ncbi:MAG: hypothetical protein CPDRYMAC_4481 [uncultured Paraburkholderia sp.]|nr:MAG: hypothetical protein CPDRYMAC_4481 [uncultured Paraburkholderia sp.]